MSEETVFDKIIAGETEADVVYEDEEILAFRDINPQAPVHILIIPKKQIRSANQITEENQELVGKLMSVASKVASEEGVSAAGYRLVVNCGDDGGQEIEHLHVHLLAGRSMEWPPG